jgi:hypothetical protein
MFAESPNGKDVVPGLLELAGGQLMHAACSQRVRRIARRLRMR